jgi:hypothetical protein
MLLERGPRPDAGEHQQLRRVERTAGENDLARRKHLPGLARLVAGMGVGAIEPFAALILNTDGALFGVEQHARRQGVQLNLEPVGMSLCDIEQPFA